MSSKNFFYILPSSFKPFNDAPLYLAGNIVSDEHNKLLISGTSRYQLEDWYNIGGRTETFDAHSFSFSVEAIPKLPLGSYSIGIISDSLASINLSHFMLSSIRLGEEELGSNRYSGFGCDNRGYRTQYSVNAPKAVGRSHNLTVEYDSQRKLLSCSANDFQVHRINASIDRFSLEIRFEAVGIAGDFEVLFDKLYYFSSDKNQPDNIFQLGVEKIQDSPILIGSTVQQEKKNINTFEVKQDETAIELQSYKSRLDIQELKDYQEFLKKLIKIKNRRLYELQLKEAKYGLETPVAILTEIADLKGEVEDFQIELREITAQIESVRTSTK